MGDRRERKGDPQPPKQRTRKRGKADREAAKRASTKRLGRTGQQHHCKGRGKERKEREERTCRTARVG
jgi:hypothetical protein